MEASASTCRATRSAARASEARAAALCRTRLSATWVAFATTGDPNNSLIPHWPAYEKGRRATMVFNNEMKVVDDYRGDFVRMIADAVPTTPDPRKA